MLAENLYHCLRLSAVTPSATELFDQFMSRFPRSVFGAALRKQFDESKALSEGEPAKDFKGFTEDGKPFQFSALKGKVVYVDFWATWCGPCIEEFPHSKKLIERFKDNDGIVFLFVSFDKDVEKWKGFADSLYPLNSNEKLQKYLRNFPVNPQIAKDLDEIFSGDLLLKHPKEVNVFLFEAFSHQDSATIDEASSELSKLSPNLKAAIGQHQGSEPDHGIVISLTENKKQEPAVLQEGKIIAGKSCMYPKIIKSKISLSFNLSDRSKKLRQQSLVSSLYFSLVPIKMTISRIDQLYTLTNGRISFTRHYADLLRVVYANELVDGCDRSAPDLEYLLIMYAFMSVLFFIVRKFPAVFDKSQCL